MDVGTATIVLAAVTFVLVVLTGFYLHETRQIRKTAEKAFMVETAPKVFLENIKSVPGLNESIKQIEITAVFQIVNVGKTEAKNFSVDYTLSSGKIRIEDKAGPIPYLFPSQRVNYQTKVLGVGLNDEQVAAAKESILMQKPYILPMRPATPIILDLTLSYLDQQEQEQKLSCKLEYIIQNNTWVLRAE